jgi:hypothetical protein
VPEEPRHCECWLAPSTQGGANPSAWLAMHDNVEIHTRDGQQMRGWPMGLRPVIDIQAAGRCRIMMWGVEDDDGYSLETEPDDVVAIAPIKSGVTEADMVRDLLGAIACPSEVPAEGLDFNFLVGSHESIEVSLKLERWPCQPRHSPPEEQDPHKRPWFTVKM